MKKLISTLFAGLMLTCFLGTANATLVRMTDGDSTRINNRGYAKVTHKISGDGYDFVKAKITFKLGGIKKTILKPGFTGGTVTTKVKFGRQYKGKRVRALMVAWGKPHGGYGDGGNHDVPEPGMLALMALVLLGLGLGPWLRKARARSIRHSA